MSPAPPVGATGTVDPGELLGTIRTLTTANRAHRDPAIERELVRLRHEAFRPPPPGTPRSRPRLPVRPSPPGPLPAIGRHELDGAALREGFSTHGCVFVPGLVAAPVVRDLVDGIDRALAACDASLEGASSSETEPWFAPFTPRAGSYRVGGRSWVRASGAVWAADSPRMLFELLELVDALSIGDVVEDFLGERPALSANKCNLRRVPAGECGDWHQDGAFLGEDVATVNLWIALDHCGRDAPTMDIVTRRIDRVLETGTDGANFDWAVAPSVVEREAGADGVVRPEFAPGDALLFDHLFLHRTARDPRMPHERHAIETWFFAPSSYPEGQIPLVY